MVRREILFLASVALFGCASQQTFHRDAHQGLPRNIAIYVVMSDEVADSDDGGAIATIVEALDDDLRERGHRPVIVAARADEAPPLPRLELQFLSADRGNVVMRGAGVSLVGASPPVGVGLLGVGSGSLVVDWYVVQADAKVSLAGSVEAPVLATDDEGYAREAERTGRSIAEAVSDG